MELNYKSYQDKVTQDIEQMLSNMGCQPILFIGAGMSTRYAGLPNWDTLLEHLTENISPPIKPINFYKQKHNHNNPLIGEELASEYAKIAWDAQDSGMFPESLYKNPKSDIFIKHSICTFLTECLARSTVLEGAYKSEIQKLISINPHAIITTNFDLMIEAIFPNYKAVVGQKIIRNPLTSYGEIYKIHGCVTEPDSLVFTQPDYDVFLQQKKYLSAKLLTYFAEHPLLFIGYSASDSNIASILSDIDEIISPENGVIDNIYLLEWKQSIESDIFEKLETVISIGNGKAVRIKCIVASDFSWVFEAFASNSDGIVVDTKILRKLLSKTYKLIRHDLAKPSLHIDYKAITDRIAPDDGIATLFGISTIDQPAHLHAHYPYVISQLAGKLNLSSWHKVMKCIEEIERLTGKSLRESDNSYHIKIMTGKSSATRKYSDKMLTLLKDHLNGNEVMIDSLD